MIEIVLFILGIFLLIKGSDIFVDYGSKIGKIFKISEIIIGLTIVSIGTSLPELIVAINGSLTDSSEIVVSNVIGTNIFSICGILAIICIINPVKFLKDTVKKDMYMSFLTGIVLLVIILDINLSGAQTNIISRTDGIILLLFFMVFIYYTLYEIIDHIKKQKQIRKIEKDEKENDVSLNSAHNEDHIKNNKIFKSIVLMVVGLVMVILGGNLVVNSTINISEKMGISETLIATIIIAIGTSFPEIFTSISAIKKEKYNIAIGNLIGSNMVNILLVLGIAAVINPIEITVSSLYIDCLIFILCCSLLLFFAKRKEKYKLAKEEGIVLILIYIAYIAFVLIRK